MVHMHPEPSARFAWDARVDEHLVQLTELALEPVRPIGVPLEDWRGSS